MPRRTNPILKLEFDGYVFEDRHEELIAGATAFNISLEDRSALEVVTLFEDHCGLQSQPQRHQRAAKGTATEIHRYGLDLEKQVFNPL